MELRFVHIDEGEFMPNKTKIFFSCHPDDMKYFNEISKDILELSYCFLYYAMEDGKPLDEEEWRFSLSEMSVMVVPITEKYLTQPNRAFDLDLKIARENHILILPIMCEDGIVDLFNKKFGEVQFLNKNSTDQSEIAYRDKLADFLKSAVKSREHTVMAMQHFKGLVFLSYRKKDRKIAQQLMKELHNDKELYDLCIWYDEFLTPGEKFNDEIAMLLQHSDLMILNVTPSIVEEGNYIINVEYPNALALNKLVLPIEMVKTDKNELNKNYDALPDIVDIADKSKILQQIKFALGSRFTLKRKKEDLLEHKYYVALGYLDGLGVAKDKELGFKLLTECAECGYEPAVYDLSTAYILGKHVKQDVDKGIAIRQTLIDKAFAMAKQKNFVKKLLGISQLLTEIANIAPIYYLMGLGDKVDSLNEEACKLIEEVKKIAKKKKMPKKIETLYRFNLLKYCINMGGRLFSLGEYQKSIYYMLEAIEHNKFRFEEMWREVHGKTPIDSGKIDNLVAFENFDSIGTAYLHMKDYENAEKYLTQSLNATKGMFSLEEDGEELAERDSMLVKHNITGAMLARLYTEIKEFDKAEKLFKESIAIQERLAQSKDDSYENALITMICSLAKTYVEAGKLKEAEVELVKAKTILDRLLTKKEKTLLLVQIGTYSEVMGDLCLKLNKSEEAMRHYQKSVIQYAKLKNNTKLDELEIKIKACKGEN